MTNLKNKKERRNEDVGSSDISRLKNCVNDLLVHVLKSTVESSIWQECRGLDGHQSYGLQDIGVQLSGRRAKSIYLMLTDSHHLMNVVLRDKLQKYINDSIEVPHIPHHQSGKRYIIPWYRVLIGNNIQHKNRGSLKNHLTKDEYFSPGERARFAAWFEITKPKNRRLQEKPILVTEDEERQLIHNPPPINNWSDAMMKINLNTFKSRSKKSQLEKRKCLQPTTWTQKIQINEEEWVEFWSKLSSFKAQDPYRFEEIHRVNLGHRIHLQLPSSGNCELCDQPVSITYSDHLYLECSISRQIWTKMGITLPLAWEIIIANPELDKNQLIALNRYLFAVHKLRGRRRYILQKEGSALPLNSSFISSWVSFYIHNL